MSWRGVLSSHLNHAEEHDRAIKNAHKAIEIDESHLVAHYVLGDSYAFTGRFTEAMAEAEAAHRLAPRNAMPPTGLLAGVLARVGEKARAEVLIRQMGKTLATMMNLPSGESVFRTA